MKDDDPWDFNLNTIKNLNWRVIPLCTFDKDEEEYEDSLIKDEKFTKKYCES